MKTDCAGFDTVWCPVRDTGDIDVFRDCRLNIHFGQVHVMYFQIEYIKGYHFHHKSSPGNRN
jgi:hypothetical protein